MKTALTVVCMFFFIITGPGVSAAEKNIIGETAWIEVGGVPFAYLARIDTGARTSSIHAVEVKVIDGADRPEENVGKTVSFKTVNRGGKVYIMTAIIVRVSTVTNSQGTEQRYVVELPLSWRHVKKTVQVNLRDRTMMQYKLLIGRNWLAEDFLVDVDLEAVERGKKE